MVICLQAFVRHNSPASFWPHPVLSKCPRTHLSWRRNWCETMETQQTKTLGLNHPGLITHPPHTFPSASAVFHSNSLVFSTFLKSVEFLSETCWGSSVRNTFQSRLVSVWTLTNCFSAPLVTSCFQLFQPCCCEDVQLIPASTFGYSCVHGFWNMKPFYAHILRGKTFPPYIHPFLVSHWPKNAQPPSGRERPATLRKKLIRILLGKLWAIGKNLSWLPEDSVWTVQQKPGCFTLFIWTLGNWLKKVFIGFWMSLIIFRHGLLILSLAFFFLSLKLTQLKERSPETDSSDCTTVYNCTFYQLIWKIGFHINCFSPAFELVQIS